jgi:hypothetical protein
LVSNGDDLPRPSTVVHYAGFNRMAKDNDDRILGPFPSAFERQPDHDSLSVTWSEYYVGAPDVRLRCAIEAIRSSLNVKPKACFCVAYTEELLAIITKHGQVGRAVYLPEDDNPAHAGIYGIAPEELLLQEALAATAWSRFLTKEMANNLPLDKCTKSPHVDR